MKAKLNIHFQTAAFDSGAIGKTAKAVHQFRKEGLYRIFIKQYGKTITEAEFIVEEQSAISQLDFDLAVAVNHAKERPANFFCACCESDERHIHSLTTEGYLLLHATFGEGYSALIRDESGKSVFDSENLDKGDLFAVSFNEPSVYKLLNQSDSTPGEIIVGDVPLNSDIFTPRTKYIDVNAENLYPDKIEIVPAQGVVFKINTPARIVIENMIELDGKRSFSRHELRRQISGYENFPT